MKGGHCTSQQAMLVYGRGHALWWLFHMVRLDSLPADCRALPMHAFCSLLATLASVWFMSIFSCFASSCMTMTDMHMQCCMGTNVGPCCAGQNVLMIELTDAFGTVVSPLYQLHVQVNVQSLRCKSARQVACTLTLIRDAPAACQIETERVCRSRSASSSIWL